MSSSDVVIAGAGIAGIATAAELAVRHGITSVTLVDPRPPLTLTSDKSGANYRDWWPRAVMTRLVRRSIDLMRAHHQARASFTMNRRGYLYITTEAERARTLPELARVYQAAGSTPIRLHDAKPESTRYEPAAADGLTGPEGADILLSASLLHRTFPHLSHHICGAIHARNAGSVDPVALGQYLLASARKRGVKVLEGQVTAVESGGGRVRAVTIASGTGPIRIETARFVNAAGPFLQQVQLLAGSNLPIENVPQQKLWLPDPRGVVPPTAPFTTSLDPMDGLPAGLHIKPESVGGQVGFKLGWAFNKKSEEPIWDPPHAPDFPGLVLRAASQLLPGLEAYLTQPAGHGVQTCGYYTKTPDDLPLIGPAGPGGVTVVGGLAGYGAMAACAVGEIAAAWVAGAATPDLAKAFEPARFEDSSYSDARPQVPSGAL